MPIYEYRCNHCGQKFEIFFRNKGSDAINQFITCCGEVSPRVLSKVNLNFAAWIPSWKREIDYANGK